MSLQKKIAYAIWPRAAIEISSIRARRLSQRLLKEWGLHELDNRLVDEFGMRVIQGPFKGLILPTAARQEHIGPYLLGTYERELHAVWPEILKHQYDAIIDIGAKIGYYAAGLAMLYPRTPTLAFDTDWWARSAGRDIARVNNLANLSVMGFCSPAWLARHMSPRTLVVCDCEGCEGDLIAGCDSRAFETSTFVIELHEQFVPGVTARIRSRFRDTHVETIIDTGSSAASLPRSTRLTDDEMQRAASEARGPQQWVWLAPRARERHAG